MKAQNITASEIEKLLKREALKAAPTISGTNQKVFNKAYVKKNMQTHKQYPITTYFLHNLHSAGTFMAIRRAVDEISNLSGLSVKSDAGPVKADEICFLRVTIPCNEELNTHPESARMYSGELLQQYNELADKCALVIVQLDYTETDNAALLYELNKLLIDGRCQFYPIVVASYDDDLFDGYYQSIPEAIHFFVMDESSNESTDEQLNQELPSTV